MNMKELQRVILSDEPEDRAVVLSVSGDVLFLMTFLLGWFMGVFDSSTSNIVGYYSMLILSFMLNLTSVLLKAMVRIDRRNNR